MATDPSPTLPVTAPTPEAPDVPDPPPQALVDFMLTAWTAPAAELPKPIAHHEVFTGRRRALSEHYPGDTILVATGHDKVRSNDTHYPFRPGSDFYYLTGNLEPDGVLVLEPREGGGHKDILFVEPNPGRTNASFFTDRQKGELWVGARLGVPESRARFAIEECRPLCELTAYVAELADRTARPSRMVRGISPALDSVLVKDERDQELARLLAETRMIKDPIEIAELRAAISATQRAFDDVLRHLPFAKTEREIEATFRMRARIEGNDVGYGIIAAAGTHACILHYTSNNGTLSPNDLLLVDAGVEGPSLYTADITRVFPIGGQFSRAQRTIYDIVMRAHRAGLAEIKPGNPFQAPNRTAMRVLSEGLSELGILTVPLEKALADDQQLHKRYTLHNVSHMLGLDVHDCAQARKTRYKAGTLQAGMVLTLEPGLYFQTNDLTVPEEYRGIGVRIEDDILVTPDGHENLSAAIPREAEEVEAWIARMGRDPSTR